MSKEAPLDPYAAQRTRVEALYDSQERQVADLNPNVKTHREAIKKAKQRADKAAASADPPQREEVAVIESLTPPQQTEVPFHCTNFWRNGFCLDRDCPSPMHVMTMKPEVGEE
jgi:hypothetical protein